MKGKKNKEPFFTLKKIKKCKNEKKNLQTKNRQVKKIKEKNQNETNSPPKLLNPFPFHRTMSDLIIFDDFQLKNQIYISPIHSLVNLKHIVSIDHHKNFISINFEDPGNYPLSPVQLLISRLNSLGNNEAYTLACSLKEYEETFALILQAKKNFGNFKALLDNLDAKTVIYLKNYFSYILKNTMNEEDWWKYFENFQEENSNTPNFCMIFSEYKPYVGLQLKNFIMNNSMKRIIPCDDLNIIDDDFLCLDTREYFSVITSTIKKMYACDQLENGAFFVKTKIGMRRMIFELRKFYLNCEKNGKNIAILFSFKHDGQLEEIYQSLKTLELENTVHINNILFTKPKKTIEKDEKWKELIGLYFGSEL